MIKLNIFILLKHFNEASLYLELCFKFHFLTFNSDKKSKQTCKLFPQFFNGTLITFDLSVALAHVRI